MVYATFAAKPFCAQTRVVDCIVDVPDPTLSEIARLACVGLGTVFPDISESNGVSSEGLLSQTAPMPRGD